MTNRPRGRAVLVAAASVAALAAAPAAASAATITILGDDGNAVALSGPLNVRYMNQTVEVATGNSNPFKVDITGPNNGPVASATCTSNTTKRFPDYVGNGTYTVTVNTYAANDYSCARAPTGPAQTAPYTITASSNLTGPAGRVLTRKPGSFVSLQYNVPIDLNPGALSHDVVQALNGTVNPDGSVAGPALEQLFPDNANRVVSTRFKTPGRYVIVARAKGYTGSLSPQAFAPWSAPVTVQAVGPFDIKRLSFPDARGPSYRLAALFNERSVTGRVSIALAKGTKGKYHSLGSVKISHHAVSKRFRASGPGTYRVRFKYKGNSTVAGGYEVDKIRITRRISFRGAAVGR